MRRLLKYFYYSVGALAFALVVSWLIYMPNADQRGAWRSTTGGAVLSLNPVKASLYSESRHSCFEVIAFPAHMKLVEMLEGATVNVEGDKLYLSLDGSLDRQVFEKIDGLPDACTTVDPNAATPRDVLDATWTAMDEHYAFFNLHGVDWANRRAVIDKATDDMSVPEINTLMLEMMDGIDDGHVHFGTPETGYASPSQRPAWIPEGGSLNRAILRDISVANAGTQLAKSDSAPIFYGLRSDGIGYIVVREMDVAVPFGGNSTDAMGAAFADVLGVLSDAKALVIDVRYNPGGSDTVSFGIAGHFIDTPLPVFTKTTRDGETQANPFTAILQPYDAQADERPVVLVTSQLTGSAAEILTLAMREIPNVTTFGEATGGGLSDVMGFMLPNGWGLGLSNQTYLTMDGALYEGVGIPPDVPMAFDTAQYLAGRDPVLDAAFALAVEQTEM